MIWLKENRFKILIAILVTIILALVFWNANRESNKDPFQIATKSFDDVGLYKNLPPEAKQPFIDEVTDQKGWHFMEEKNEFNKTDNPDFPYLANNKILFSNGSGKIISRDELYLYDGYGWQIFSWSEYEFDSKTDKLNKKDSKVIWDLSSE